MSTAGERDPRRRRRPHAERIRQVWNAPAKIECAITLRRTPHCPPGAGHGHRHLARAGPPRGPRTRRKRREAAAHRSSCRTPRAGAGSARRIHPSDCGGLEAAADSPHAGSTRGHGQCRGRIERLVPIAGSGDPSRSTRLAHPQGGPGVSRGSRAGRAARRCNRLGAGIAGGGVSLVDSLATLAASSPFDAYVDDIVDAAIGGRLGAGVAAVDEAMLRRLFVGAARG